MVCHFLLQGSFPTQGLNPHLLHWQVDSLSLELLGKSDILSMFLRRQYSNRYIEVVCLFAEEINNLYAIVQWENGHRLGEKLLSGVDGVLSLSVNCCQWSWWMLMQVRKIGHLASCWLKILTACSLPEVAVSSTAPWELGFRTTFCLWFRNRWDALCLYMQCPASDPAAPSFSSCYAPALPPFSLLFSHKWADHLHL